MSIRDTDPLVSAAPDATPSEGEAADAVSSTEWSVIEPGKSPLPRTPRNQPETDLATGSTRKAALLPFALSLMGRPYKVWDLATGLQVERTERLSLKDHVPELVRNLSCGADFIYKCVLMLCEAGPENVKISSLLKGAPSGGKGRCRTRANKPELFLKAIEDVCVTRGLRPGREKALKEIRLYLSANGWMGKLPSDKTLRKHTKAAWVLSARADSYERDHLYRVIGKPAESLGLMSMVQLDTTTFTDDDSDVLRVVNEQGQDLGPANVIFGILGANRAVWTFMAFVGAANSYLAGLSVQRGLLAKNLLLHKYGIQGVYPYSGHVGEIRHDNGSEFIAQHLKDILVLRDVKVNFDESSPVETPHYRGKEERFNRTAHKLFKDFLDSDQGKRYVRSVNGNKNAKGIRLTDLDKALMEWVVLNYHTRGHKGLGGDSPNSRFEKLAEGRDGLPASGLSMPLAPSDELDWDFMCEDARVVNHLGIVWENRVYRSSELQLLFVLNKRSSMRRVPFRYNPYGIGAIFVKVPDGKGGEKIIKIPWVSELEKYPMTEEVCRASFNPSIWEWRAIYSILRRAGNAKPSAGLIEEIHAKQEAEAESARKQGAPKKRERIATSRNQAMRKLLGTANLPATAPTPTPAAAKPPRHTHRPVYLPVAAGHDAY